MNKYERLNELTVEQVVHVPQPMVHGVLYISKRFETALHLCACGCGEQVVTPQPRGPDSGWVLSGTDDCVTLRPSIGNPWCKAHYYVTDNKINWL
jgi:hypothetical protein